MPQNARSSFRSALFAAVALTSLALAQVAAAQITRVVIFPFDVEAAVQTYQLGLPVTLQRSLNQIPGVFAPPVGDAALVASRAANTGQDVSAVAGRLFDASAMITGQVTTGGGGVRATINVLIGGGTQTVEVSGASPRELAVAAADAVAAIIRPGLAAATRQAVTAAAQQTPSLPSFGATALAASGLPGATLTNLDAAVQLDPSSAWVLVEYARLQALSGTPAAAAETAARAAAAAPGDADILATAGVVLASAGQFAQAELVFAAALSANRAHAVALAGRSSLPNAADPITDLQTAIEAYPRFVDAHLRLASGQSDQTRAIQVLRRAETFSPESVLLRGNVIERLLAAGDPSGALAYLRQSVTEPLARSAGLYALARHLPSSQLDGALALVAEGQAAYPDSTELVVAEADLLLQAGRTAEAEEQLTPLYQANPNNTAIGGMLAAAKARRGDVSGAREIVEAQRSGDPLIERRLAELYLAAGRAAAALETLRPLVQQSPGDGELLAMFGTALARMGRLDEGEEALMRALQVDAGNLMAQRALTLLQQQRQLTGASQVALDEEAGAAFQQGMYALDVEDYAAAAQAFGRSREIQENGLTAFYQGYARQLDGDVRSAIADYQVALSAFPGSDIVLNNLGYAHYEVGRYDLALDNLRLATTTNPANANAHLNLGLVYFALERYPQAISSLEEASRLDTSLAGVTQDIIAAARQRTGQ